MKTVVFLLGCVISFTALNQTKLIALKRHSASIDQINGEAQHNFGEYIVRNTDSIIYLADGCFIEVGSMNFGGPFRDSICGHYNFANYSYTVDEIKKMYGKRVQFENLETYAKERKKFLKSKANRKKGFQWLFLLIPLGLMINLGRNKVQKKRVRK